MAELINHEKHESKLVKILKRTVDISMMLIIILLTILIVIFAISVRSGEQPSLLDYKIFIVQSNSMSPEFETGALLIVDTGDVDLEAGYIITYQKDESKVSTTHRIVEIQEGETTRYITRGDANSIDDPLPVFEEEIIGKVSLILPLVGYIFGFIQTRTGLLVLMLVPSLIIIILIVREIMKELEKGKLSL